jgi:hypothetical protein
MLYKVSIPPIFDMGKGLKECKYYLLTIGKKLSIKPFSKAFTFIILSNK